MLQMFSRFDGFQIVRSPHMEPAFGFIQDHPLYAWWQRKVWRRRRYNGGFAMATGKPHSFCIGNTLHVPADVYAALQATGEAGE